METNSVSTKPQEIFPVFFGFLVILSQQKITLCVFQEKIVFILMMICYIPKNVVPHILMKKFSFFFVVASTIDCHVLRREKNWISAETCPRKKGLNWNGNFYWFQKTTKTVFRRKSEPNKLSTASWLFLSFFRVSRYSMSTKNRALSCKKSFSFIINWDSKLNRVGQFLQMMSLGFLNENYQFEGAFVFNTEMASGHDFSFWAEFFLFF